MEQKKKRQRATHFTFKHFTIHQDKCGMKVCTDSVIFGAFISQILEKIENLKNLLDIGSGTGLLSIMMAQKFEFEIDAVEYDSNAFSQSLENMKEISFCKNVKIHECMIQKFDKDGSYDCIISNPPFYDSGFLPNQKVDVSDSKVKAIHTVTLSHDDLIDSIGRLIKKKDGILFILLPEFEMKDFEKKISEKLDMFPFQKLVMKFKKDSPILRVAQGFSFDKTLNLNLNEIIFRNEDNHYSTDYFELTKDYFIKEHFNKKN
jgi:tRNA1Val (adenine37-N6)-methyltransferase